MKLKEWLKKNRLTNRAFAKDLGIGEAYLCSLMKGKHPFCAATAIRIVSLTNHEITLQELLMPDFVIPKIRGRKKDIDESIKYLKGIYDHMYFKKTSDDEEGSDLH